MIRYAFVAVFFFAAGVATRDQAQEYTQEARACRETTDNAERYARAIASALNGGGFHTDDTRVACRAFPIRKEIL